MDISCLIDCPDHKDEVAELIKQEWGEYLPVKPGQSQVNILETHLNRDKLPIAVVATKGNELLGFYNLMVQDPVNLPHLSPWLGSLFVKQEHRGKGIAGQLLKHSNNLAKRLGVSELYLCTAEAQGLYEKHGFRQLGEVEFNGVTTTVMTCYL